MKRKNYIYPGVTVINVVDGDTFDAIIKVDVGFGIETALTDRFRVMLFDSPEIFHPVNDAELQHGKLAKSFAQYLLIGNPVTIQSYKGEKYGRYLAKITLHDGRDFAEAMIEKGFQKKKSYL